MTLVNLFLQGRLLLGIVGSLWLSLTARGDTEYLRDIKPLLQARCYTCHGALKQKGGLRLDTAAALRQGGKSGPAIVRREGVPSPLLERVTATEVTERMPPEHEGEPLNPAQVAHLRNWLAAGAPAPADERPESDPHEHWAFRPRVRPAVPSEGKDAPSHWARNPLDAFIAQQQRQRGLTPQPEAPRGVLVRRLYLDLVGEPPSAAELAAFEADPTEAGYARTVERLLDDPRHGERWARHWMDIWRYSDWWGLGEQLRNSQKHIWHWRDWIVDALNADTPYDEMVRLMLAADESHPDDLEKLRATGFLARNYFLFNRNQWLEETVEHVSKGFLGLTVNCAKCHDHKYDPVAQTDFYRLRAFFEPYHVRLDVVPGEPDLERDGIPRVYDGLPDVPTYRFVRGQENAPDRSASLSPGVPELLNFRPLAIQPVPLPETAWQPERRPWVLAAHLAAARQKVATADTAALQARRAATNAPAGESSAVQVAELAAALARAELVSVERRGEAMRWSWAPTGTNDPAPAALAAEHAVTTARARHQLAAAELRLQRAAADQKGAIEKDVATARTALESARKTEDSPATTPASFTRLSGARWTPTRFLSSEKDDPTVGFVPRSTGRRTALAAWITDPRNPLPARVAVNHLWARHFGTPLVATAFDFGRKGSPPTHPELLDWLASELVESGWSLKHLHRLIVLSATYRLGSSVAGAEANLARDPDNRSWWRRTPIRLEAETVRDSLLALAGTLDPRLGGPSVPAAEQAASMRRSLYFFHSNNDRNLFLTTFDAAGVKECYRREQSIVPQQALALVNSGLVQDAALRIAARLSPPEDRTAATPERDQAFIRTAFRRLLGSEVRDDELAACLQALAAWRQLPTPTNPSEGPAAEPARANLIWALLNHNDFVTLR